MYESIVPFLHVMYMNLYSMSQDNYICPELIVIQCIFPGPHLCGKCQLSVPNL